MKSETSTASTTFTQMVLKPKWDLLKKTLSSQVTSTTPYENKYHKMHNRYAMTKQAYLK